MNQVLGVVAVTTAVLVLLQPARQQTPFHSIDVRNSGHVTLRPGSAPRVTLVKGTRDYTSVVVNDGVLVIDRCRTKCPRGYQLEVAVTVPGIDRISLANGGSVQSIGKFPGQDELEVAVRNGGIVDVRGLAADRVDASVEQGGGILAFARTALTARVAHGGAITHWGSAVVKSSVQKGGVVHAGKPDQIDAPLSEIKGQLTAPHHPPRHKR